MLVPLIPQLQLLMSCYPQLHLSRRAVILSHDSVHLTITVSLEASKHVTATQHPPQHPRSIWRYDHADFELANELLSQVNEDSILIGDDINTSTSWARWEKQFLEIMKQCVPQCPAQERESTMVNRIHCPTHAKV